MASPDVIIPHGSTPTGLGIRQRRSGALRAISRCCGRMISSSGNCHGCGMNYNAEASRICAGLGNDVELKNADLSTWVARVTGYYGDVEVSITWS